MIAAAAVALIQLAVIAAAGSASDSVDSALTAVSAEHDSAAVGKYLATLMRDPPASARRLVSELHVVRKTHITAAEFPHHPSSLRVVWAMRGLRYITHGLEFRAPTSNPWGEGEEERRHFLYDGGSEVAFFATRMSTEALYFAPVDAQKAIITEWNHWLREESPRFRFQAAERFEDWYF